MIFEHPGEEVFHPRAEGDLNEEDVNAHMDNCPPCPSGITEEVMYPSSEDTLNEDEVQVLVGQHFKRILGDRNGLS
jgi:hypothetical protein